MGYYFIRTDFGDKQTPDLYQRLGVKYHIWDDIFMGLDVKFTELSRADYLEWSIGYKINWF